MMNFFNFFICLLCVIVISSCDDNGTNDNNNTLLKMKITIYNSYSGDTNDFVKYSEYFFDGDVDGYPRRMFLKGAGNYNYQSTLVQERSNVPLPLHKFGCLIKNIEYSNDSVYFAICRLEYDSDGYINQAYLDSYTTSNKSSYGIYSREGEKLVKLYWYKENMLDEIRAFFYDVNGLCTLQVDSSIASSYVRKTLRRYNDKKECVYVFHGNDTTSGSVSEYFYDNNGNNIKQISYNKHNNDTSKTKVYNWVMYKGYRMKEKDIERYEFDSKNNIIGYRNLDFGNTRCKIEYTYY